MNLWSLFHFLFFMGNNSFLQWNCRGLISNLDDINDILDKYNIVCACLQETYLTTQSVNPFRCFDMFRKDRIGTARASGGVAILTAKSVPTRPFPVTTDLEAVAVQVCLDSVITVCSLYLPPSESITQKQFEDLCDQLPAPFMILGDLNAHSPLWGGTKVDCRGKMLEKVILSRAICLLNTGSPTHVNISTRSFSVLDLSLCSPSLFQLVDWNVERNPYGSDHFPVILSFPLASQTLTLRPPRWRLSEAKWDVFQNQANLQLSSLENADVEEMNEIITSTIINAATQSIQQTSGRLPRRPKPWWTTDCETTRKEQNKAWGVFRRYPTTQNLISFKKARARARWTRRKAKRESWKSFISTLNRNTPSKVVWDRIRKIKGDYRSFSVPLLQINGVPCNSLEEQANALGNHFHNVSSSLNYSREFLKIKASAEKYNILGSKSSNQPYNKLFTMSELMRALSISKVTAPGPDRIAYSMLQHLSENSLECLLHFFNTVWKKGCIPSQWKLATIIPLLKPGKDASNVTSYRPIALTSCLGKTFERIVNNRLVYVLEENGCINRYQCGFRAGCSTADHLVRLETTIREAFVKRQHCLSVFFDLERAYDTAWRYGILRDLHALGVRGRMLYCIADFLQGRTFRIQIGGTLSRPFTQENGVPQGSVLSVTLFIVKMNSVANTIPPSVSYSLYVDDIQISYCSSNLVSCERQIQLTINKLTKWANTNGFRFSPGKTACVLFSRIRGAFPEPSLGMNGHDLVVRPQHKFLGVTFDRKLSFLPHIQGLKTKSIKSLNILKILSHRSWGADKETLHRIYMSAVRSGLDYGCMVYGSARPFYLKQLDPVHHEGLRLILGAFRTSPAESLYVEGNEWSLERRRQYLSLCYGIRVRSYPNHPALFSVQNTWYTQLFLNKPSFVRPFSMRIREQIEQLDFQYYDLLIVESPKLTPPWHLPPKHDTSMTKFPKRTTSSVVLKQEFEALKEGFGHHIELYTDGSKTNSSVSCAMVTESTVKSHRIRALMSIFSAEIYAIILALNYIIQNDISSAVIYTDSLSAVQSVCGLARTKNHLVQRARYSAYSAINRGCHLVLCWLPSHVGIWGNERADRAAVAALTADVTPFEVPSQDLKLVLKRAIDKKWQESWNNKNKTNCNLLSRILENQYSTTQVAFKRYCVPD